MVGMVGWASRHDRIAPPHIAVLRLLDEVHDSVAARAVAARNHAKLPSNRGRRPRRRLARRSSAPASSDSRSTSTTGKALLEALDVDNREAAGQRGRPVGPLRGGAAAKRRKSTAPALVLELAFCDPARVARARRHQDSKGALLISASAIASPLASAHGGRLSPSLSGANSETRPRQSRAFLEPWL